METKIEKLKSSRIKTTTVLTPEERTNAEKKALQALAKHVRIKGFREGMAPPEMVRGQITDEQLQEETVRAVLPSVLADAMKLSEAKPIIRPSASVTKDNPLTISLVFVERPEATLKKPEKISVEKKKVDEAGAKDIDEFIDKLLKSDGTEKPELTREFIKTRLGADRSPEDFKKDVGQMLSQQKKNEEIKRREEELYKKVKEATEIDIAPELVDAEVQEMLHDLQERLKSQQITVEQWLEQTKKTWKQVAEEMKTIATDRIILRFGMQLLVDHKKVEPDETKLQAAMESERMHAKEHGHDVKEADLQAGGSVYEQAKWELTMQKMIGEMIEDAPSTVKKAA